MLKYKRRRRRRGVRVGRPVGRGTASNHNVKTDEMFVLLHSPHSQTSYNDNKQILAKFSSSFSRFLSL